METVLGMTDLQIKLFTALGQLSVAGIVGYIAWQQWRTAQKKLKADLFDKRFSAYRELVSAVEALCSITMDDELVLESDIGLNSISQIMRLGHEASWLFDKATSNHVIENMVPRAETIVGWRFEWVTAEVKGTRWQFRGEATKEVALLLKDLNTLTISIGPYLELQH